MNYFKDKIRIDNALKTVNKFISQIRISVEILWAVYDDICLGIFL